MRYKVQILEKLESLSNRIKLLSKQIKYSELTGEQTITYLDQLKKTVLNTIELVDLESGENKI